MRGVFAIFATLVLLSRGRPVDACEDLFAVPETGIVYRYSLWPLSHNTSEGVTEDMTFEDDSGNTFYTTFCHDLKVVDCPAPVCVRGKNGELRPLGSLATQTVSINANETGSYTSGVFVEYTDGAPCDASGKRSSARVYVDCDQNSFTAYISEASLDATGCHAVVHVRTFLGCGVQVYDPREVLSASIYNKALMNVLPANLKPNPFNHLQIYGRPVSRLSGNGRQTAMVVANSILLADNGDWRHPSILTRNPVGFSEISLRPGFVFFADNDGLLWRTSLANPASTVSAKLGEGWAVRGDAVDDETFAFVNGMDNAVHLVNIATGKTGSVGVPKECDTPLGLSVSGGMAIVWCSSLNVFAGELDTLETKYYSWALLDGYLAVSGAAWVDGEVWVQHGTYGLLHGAPGAPLKGVPRSARVDDLFYTSVMGN